MEILYECRIANATEKDAGVYACIVGTSEEHVKSVAHLTVEEGAEYIATSVARDPIQQKILDCGRFFVRFFELVSNQIIHTFEHTFEVIIWAILKVY